MSLSYLCSVSRFALVCGAIPLVAAPAIAQGTLELRKGDHVAVVGSGLADRQQHAGWLEAMIHRTYPDLDLTIRNLGFSADEIDEQPRSANAPTLEYFLGMRKGDTQLPGSPAVYKAGTDFGAKVILAYWGFNESFRGPAGVEKFKGTLSKWLDAQKAANYSGDGPPRIVLLSPIAHEDLKNPDFGDGRENNANLALYTEAMAAVAKEKGILFVDLFHPSLELYKSASSPLTINGIHLTDAGDKALAPLQYKALFGREAPAADPQLLKIREVVLEKNREWHHRYRTVDQYNIYGDRSRIDYAGVMNAKTMGEEMAQRDIKTANRDKRIWAVAKGGDLVVKDDNLGGVSPVPPNREDVVTYTDPEEAIKHLKLPEGLKVELIASEKTYPELVNPVQMNFDTKGRLWVAAWKNYPETAPTTKDFDKLLVFDLDPKTGKPTKMTTFLDGLNCPTGFQFYKDGVLIIQSPDLWYVRDTDGDGKADWKERVLTGLDAADSHHETNSMCLEPGGAVYLSDGVFHRSNIETVNGPVRNRDGAIYRYEPRTGKFMRHAPYGFANPHGRVFDYWGNDLISDATGNDNYFGPAMSGHLDAGAHPPMKTFWDRPSRPTPGTAILTSRHFPDDWQGLFLNTNVISIQGIFRARLKEEGSGIKGETLEHLVTTDIAANPNFRPSGITVAPDGSLYFMDWSQMLIGHLQHHLRDPNRDRQHGRLYRITYEGRPLLVPKKIDGEPIAALLELLKEPENDVRTRAKIELDKHNSKEVTAAAKQWVARLDKSDPAYEHHVLEGLWVHQWHNVVDLDLLKQVLTSPEPKARAQGIRVLGYWRDRVPEALTYVKKAAVDESPRVRLEAVRVASFFRDWKAADAALASLAHPSDYYLDYCLRETMRQLQPVWKVALKDGQPLADGNPRGIDYLTASLSGDELSKLPKSIFSLNALLTRSDISDEQRQQALVELAGLKNDKPINVLLETLVPAASGGGRVAGELAGALPDLPVEELKANRAAIEKLASPLSDELVRHAALASIIVADGSLNPTWEKAIQSFGNLRDFLAAIPMVQDPAIRADATKRVLPLLNSFPASLGKEASTAKAGVARYIRIELPEQGTLTLAEVEAIAEGRNVARAGKATQSSVAFNGVAQRAIDGNHDGNYGSGTLTHTKENETNPWWELDLQSSTPVSAVTVWNRDQLQDRLDKFTLTVFDEHRREIFKRSNIPAPSPSLTIEIPSDPTAGARVAVIHCLSTLKADPQSLFSGLAGLLERGELVSAAARAISQLPEESASDKAKITAAVKGIHTWAAAIPARERSGVAFRETIEVGTKLAGKLAEPQASNATRALNSLLVRSIVVSAVREQLRYDTKRLVVEVGKPFQVTLKNPDAMPHNIVFVLPNTMKAVAESVQTQAPDQLDSQGRSYVPVNDPRVLGASRMVEAGQEDVLEMTAPAKEGVYEFVCTFPGHWSVMNGKLVVTRDVEAYLKANPE